MSKPFRFPIGIELTAIPQILPRPHLKHMNMIAYQWARLIEYELKTQRIKYHDCSSDGHCVEASSPILRSMEEAELYYHRVRSIFDKYHLAPKHSDAVCGGGHIHVGPLKPRQHAKVCRLACMHPWLNWMFLEPDDTDSSFTFQIKFPHNKELQLVKKNILENKAPEYDNDITIIRYIKTMYATGKLHKNDVHHDWDTLVDPDSQKGTMEFRLFEAPYSWAEQRLQIEFALAFVQHAISLPDSFIPAPSDEQDLSLFGIDRCRKMMRGLFKQLRLDTKSYMTFFERNLDIRISEQKQLV